jgi:hypothetical protein
MADDKRIFISYSLSDRPIADKLRKALADFHVQIFDPADAGTGEKAFDQIEQALKGADLFVYIVPEKEGSGKWSLSELGAAKALGKRIMAVLADSGRVANSEVAAKLADSLVLDQSPNEVARKILEEAA